MNATDAQNIIDQYTNDYPIKVGSIASALGINVYTTDELPPNTSGSIVKEEDGNFSIYVKDGQSPRRQRFTIAHELGHFVEHGDEMDGGQEMISPITKKAVPAMHRPDKQSKAADELKVREREADQFAANLLMPEVKFQEVWSTSNSLSEVADFFGVSPMAANVRAILLGLGYFDESVSA